MQCQCRPAGFQVWKNDLKDAWPFADDGRFLDDVISRPLATSSSAAIEQPCALLAGFTSKADLGDSRDSFNS
jgi:hypothetical protein